MSRRGAKAGRLFRQGSSCAQAVFCAYADLLGLDSGLAMRLSASFGAGVGRMREVCGCVSAMAMIAGYFTGSTDPADQQTKADNYACVQELAGRFRALRGTILCRELLGLERAEGVAVPEARTAQYYAGRPCEQLIQEACEIIEERFPQLARGEEGAGEMELWDVYDSDRRQTGRTMVRGDRFRPGEYHLVVHICIFNSEGQLLIQRRQPFKKGFPGLWDVTVGGSAVAGDTSSRAAEREVEEEIGLKLDLQGVLPRFSFNFSEGFDDFYLLHREVKPEELKLQESEVAEVRWATKEEVLELIEAGLFVPYRRTVIELLFENADYGAHRREYD